MASFNTKLRKAVYGQQGAGTNPLLGMPAGVIGTTWRGTGFEQPPVEPVDLDAEALPWELKPEAEPAAAPQGALAPTATEQEAARGKHLPISPAVVLVIGVIVYGVLNGGFYS